MLRAVPRSTNQTPRLRADPLPTGLHVVLVEPEIPPNTGNIARLCAATATRLHLVGTLGFRIDEHAVRRAGVDSWHLVDLQQHVDFPHFEHSVMGGGGTDGGGEIAPRQQLHIVSATAKRSYLEADFAPGDALIFGRESVGLPEELLARYPDRVLAIPTLGAVRSLNLANAVSITLYEALRKVGALESTFMG